MNFEPSEDQAMILETFARFFDEHSSMERVRAALPGGFDAELWRAFAEMGGLAMRVPEATGGIGLGLFDAALVMEEAGRTLASAPIAEGIVAARLLAVLGNEELLGDLATGNKVVTLAMQDAGTAPRQLVQGGPVADAVLVLDDETVYAVTPAEAERAGLSNPAGSPLGWVTLDSAGRTALGSGQAAAQAFREALEEWKLLTAAALAGLSREAIRLASAYASERTQFGQLIGTFQGISHPLADLVSATDGGKFLVWRAVREIADGKATAGATISLALWWNARTATEATAQSLHTFGGYGLTTEYDIHLYNLRAKSLPLVHGDPGILLGEAANRMFGGANADLPEAGVVSIDFDFGDEARALAAEADAFFKAVLTPELKAKAHFSFDGHDAGVFRKLAEAGLLFPSWPEELGGRGAAPLAEMAAMRVWMDHGWTTYTAGTTGMVGFIVNRFGTPRLKEEVLTRIARGEVVCSLGFSEPSSGSDVFAAKTRATKVEGGWRIDGQKMFTSGANIADYVLMLARTDPDVAKHRGLSMFIVPLKSEGVEIQPVYTFMDERTNITYYDSVFVPDDYLLGEANAGARVMAASLELEHGGSWAHSQWQMLHEAQAFCRASSRGGRPLIDDPLVSSRLAHVAANAMVAELLQWRSIWASINKKPNLGYGSMCKMFSSEAFRADSAVLMDICAPASLLDKEGPAAYVNLSYRHAQGTITYGGTSEVHRSVVAERTLNLPRTRA